MKNYKGISLIEVLVALLVVSLGLLALASFQGNLMSTSGENKTRAEAQNLAEDKLEELKNNIVKTGFDAALVDGTDTITGSNASFTRTWTVSDGALINQKLISVNVAWTSDSITITNESVWYNPATGVVADAAGDGAGNGALAPSPNNNSSQVGGESRLSTTDGTQLGDPSDSSDPLRDFWVAEDSEGRKTVYYDGQTTAALTCFGDVVLQFTGTLYSINTLTGKDIDISQLGACSLGSAETPVSGFNVARYACVACGNCEDSAGLNGCPATPNPSNDIGPGGWRGKIGVRGVGDTAGNQEQVCFNEQVLDADAGASTGREYTTHRTVGTAVSSEGINTPYECHDFLIVNRSGSNSSCATAANTLASATNLAPKKFTRELSDSEPNTVLALDSSYCTTAPNTISIQGTVTVTAQTQLNKLTLTMGSGGACDPLTATSNPLIYTYECTATTGATTISISLTTSQTTGAQAQEVVAPSTLTITGITGDATYTGQNFTVQNAP